VTCSASPLSQEYNATACNKTLNRQTASWLHAAGTNAPAQWSRPVETIETGHEVGHCPLVSLYTDPSE